MVPIHIIPEGPCEDFGFYSEMVSIGNLWTGEQLNSHSNTARLLYTGKEWGKAGGQLGDSCNDPAVQKMMMAQTKMVAV